jgi:hypothetical protein
MGPVQTFLDDLAWTPQWVAIFAGALNYREYNPLVRRVLRKISVRNGGPADTSRDYDPTRWDHVERSAKDFANGESESPFRQSSIPFATRTLNVLMSEFEQRLVQRIYVLATPDEVGVAIKSLNRSDMWLAEFLARLRNFGIKRLIHRKAFCRRLKHSARPPFARAKAMKLPAGWLVSFGSGATASEEPLTPSLSKLSGSRDVQKC